MLKESSIRMAKRIKEGVAIAREENEKSVLEEEENNNYANSSREIQDVADGGVENEVNISLSKVPEESDEDELYPLALEEIFEIDEKEEHDDQDVTDYQSEEKIDGDQIKESSSGIQQPNVYFLSLVATDANDFRNKGKGIPRKCRYFFDVRSEMEFI